MDELIEYMNTTHVGVEAPNLMESQAVVHLIQSLEKADLNILNEYFNSIQNVTELYEFPKNESDDDYYDYRSPKLAMKFITFKQIIPFVGTTPSALFIRNLIRDTNNTELQDQISERLLRDLPTNLKCPSEALLNELEDLKKLGKPESKTRNAGILAFSSLIKRTYENSEKEAGLEKWVRMFMEKLRGELIQIYVPSK